MTHRSEVRLPTFNLLMELESDEIYLHFSYLTSVHWVRKSFKLIRCISIQSSWISTMPLSLSNHILFLNHLCKVPSTYLPIQYLAIYLMVGLKSCYYLLKLLRYCIFLGIDIVATTVLSTNPDLRAKIPQKLLKRCAPQKSFEFGQKCFLSIIQKRKKRSYLDTFWKVGWADYLVK